LAAASIRNNRYVSATTRDANLLVAPAIEEEPPLEREHEIAALSTAVADARAGGGTLTVVEGPPGIGKSRLLEWVRRLARGTGMEVLDARGEEYERGFSFGVVLQLLERLIAGARAPERRRLLSGAAGLASVLFDGGVSEAEVAVVSIVHGLFWLLSNLAERGPVALLVDDVHAADEASLQFLLYLCRRVDELPIALVAAARSGEPAGGALAALLSTPVARVLHPQPLSERAVAELVRAGRFADAEEEFCRACTEVTGGNPFLVRELIATLAQEGVPPTAASSAVVRQLAPEAVSRSVLLRLSRLGPEPVALARAVAVLGEEAPLSSAAALAELDPDSAASAAAALASGDILRREESLSFVHPIVRSAVYDDVAPPERGRAHLHAARLLAAGGSSEEAVAAHVVKGTPASDGWAVEILRSAAERALRRGAPEAAAAFLRRALEEPPPPDLRADVLVELGRTEAAAGEAAAADHLYTALDLLEEPRRRAEVLLAAGRALYALGRYGEAAEAFDRGAAEASGDDELEAELRAAYVTVGRLDAAHRAASLDRLEDILGDDPQGDTPGERALLAELAIERVFAGEGREEALALARRALGDGALLREQTSDGMAVYVVTGVLVWAEEFDLEHEILDQALADARRRGSVWAFATASYCRMLPEYAQGRIRAAIADGEHALDARRHGWEMFLPMVCGCLGLCLVELDDLEGALRAVALEDPERWEGSVVYGPYLSARGQVRLATGDAAGALDDLLAAGRTLLELSAPNPAFTPWRSSAALAASRLGDAERARTLANEEVELARRWGASGALGNALRGAALVSAGEERIALLAEAVDTLEHSQAVLYRMKALLDYGRALRRAGKRADAREPLRRALDLAHGLGVTAVARRAKEELIAAGARPRRAALRGVDSLTPGELRVAEMAATGLTNRQIAEALFVTRKTVDWHLHHIYQKLSVTRDDLGRVLEATAG
jgi:DNA-binding CsgD family transcriptional regulator